MHVEQISQKLQVRQTRIIEYKENDILNVSENLTM